jgi:hypothetical protein
VIWPVSVRVVVEMGSVDQERIVVAVPRTALVPQTNSVSRINVRVSVETEPAIAMSTAETAPRNAANAMGAVAW